MSTIDEELDDIITVAPKVEQPKSTETRRSRPITTKVVRAKSASKSKLTKYWWLFAAGWVLLTVSFYQFYQGISNLWEMIDDAGLYDRLSYWLEDKMWMLGLKHWCFGALILPVASMILFYFVPTRETTLQEPFLHYKQSIRTGLWIDAAALFLAILPYLFLWLIHILLK